jgi:hypothetical protein
VVGLKTYVAYSYPYTTADLAALLQTLPDRQGLQQAELCRSAENRPVPYLRLGNHETPRQSVWIIARQHAGETPASFVVEGMVQWMARLDPRVMQALSHTAFHVVPMVDVDGVFHGRYGKDEQPVDFNRDWRDPPVRPEIRALVKAIRASNARHPVDGVLDVHASHHGDTSCYMFGAPQPEGKDGEDGEDAFERQGRLVRCLAGEAPPDIGFRETDLRAEPPPARSARQYLSELLRAPVLTMEMSYHLAQSGETLTPRHYRDFGAALARALHRSLHADSV